MSARRVDWVDTAKGICIIFVVMMHSVLAWKPPLARQAGCMWSSPLQPPSACRISS